MSTLSPAVAVSAVQIFLVFNHLPRSRLKPGFGRSNALLCSVKGDPMSEEHKRMTTDAGRPMGDNQNSLTVGPRGPVVFEDILLFEKMAHFNLESIPERIVAANLFNAIAMGDFPKWRVCIQIMPENEADTYHINPFDLTKVWPHKDYPLVEVGELVLDRNPANYFAEVEQAAFEPRNIVPGMGFSPD